MSGGPNVNQQALEGSEHGLRRELYFFALYRALEAAMLVFAAFSPVAASSVQFSHPLLAGAAAVGYLVIALGLVVIAGQSRFRLARQAASGLALDIGVALLFFHVSSGIDTAIGLMMLVNVGAGALLLSLRTSLALAAVMAAGGLGELFISRLAPQEAARDLVEAVMLAVSYLAVAVLCNQLGRQMRETSQLAAQRGLDLVNLSQLNELIIRRMRTGVLVVDASNHLQLSNEAAWNLLGQPSPNEQFLGTLAPALARRLDDWQRGRPTASEALSLGVEGI